MPRKRAHSTPKKLSIILCFLLLALPCISRAATETTIQVEWGYTPPTSPEVVGYTLYQDGVYACETDVPTATSMSCQIVLTSSTSSFTLTANFSDGTESPHSAPCAYSIPDKVQQLYTSYLARAADQEGLAYWTAEILSGNINFSSLEDLLIGLSPEHEFIFGNLSRYDLVIRVYNNLFMRTPNDEEMLYWTTGAGSQIDPKYLIATFLKAASGTDRQVLTNVNRVANYYTETLGDNINFDFDMAASCIEYVDATEYSVTEALNLINSWNESTR